MFPSAKANAHSKKVLGAGSYLMVLLGLIG
jgi:hypothetical protein